MRFVHNLRIVLDINVKWVREWTHLETEHTIQIAQLLGHNVKHVEEGTLQILLHRHFRAISGLDLQLRRECITSPEQRPFRYDSVSLLRGVPIKTTHAIVAAESF